MRIIIETIPHEQQRYPTVGDWFYDPSGDLVIRVSQMPDERYGLLVALHELVEAQLCLDRGITQEQVDAYDIEFERNRPPGNDSEPGDCMAAPYHNEHCFATGIERLMAGTIRSCR